MPDNIIVLVTRIIITGIAVYFIYLAWTKNVNFVSWFKEKVTNTLPIDDTVDKQLELVNVLITPNQQRELCLLIQIDESVDKIQDIELTITTKKGGKVGLLKTIRDYKYYYDLLFTPYSTTDLIDNRILAYQKFSNTGINGVDWTKVNLESFNSDELILKWRDAENKKHIKKWPYERYRTVVDGLKKGPIQLEKGKNVYVSKMEL
jgi:hypothetical protein